MNSKYPFFKYVTGDSKMHLMNSKTKILWFMMTFITILLVKDYLSIAIISLFLISLMLISKINFLTYLSNSICLFVFYLLIFSITFSITFNLNIAIMITLKVFLIIILFLILTFTTSLSEIAWGFECCFSKLKKINIPVSKISLRIAMDLKFISSMFEQSKMIKKSMAYRGISNKNIFKPLFIFSKVIPLSYRLSRKMEKIMRLRFYGNKKRTNYRENKITIFDKSLVVIPFIILYFVIWLGWC